MTLANKLTFFRLGLVPVFMAALAFQNLWGCGLALLIFIGASLTDLYDGRLARRTGTVTRIGTLLDPLADKLLIAAALISFVEIHSLLIPAWPVILIIAREFLITGLRSLAAIRGTVMAADTAGKWKTAVQITAIIMILIILFLWQAMPLWSSLLIRNGPIEARRILLVLKIIPQVLVYITMLITVISGMIYIRKYRKLLREELAMHKTPKRR